MSHRRLKRGFKTHSEVTDRTYNTEIKYVVTWSHGLPIG